MIFSINGLVNVILSFSEIILCYAWLCVVIIERKYLQIKDKVTLGVSIILLGTILTINRTMVFASYTLLIIVIFITVRIIDHFYHHF